MFLYDKMVNSVRRSWVQSAVWAVRFDLCLCPSAQFSAQKSNSILQNFLDKFVIQDSKFYCHMQSKETRAVRK